MNKINRLFSERGDRKLLSLYFCAGCPKEDMTADVILAMQRHGIDMIEVGIPFSDPLADGPVIQSAGTVALKNGMTLETLFGQLDAIKSQVNIPLVLMGYLNEIKPLADRYNLRCIMMITPETSEERIRFIDRNTDGFIYMVSSASITGAQQNFDEAKQQYFQRINAMNLHNPRMIGFGISNRQTLESAQNNAAGAIIGSKFVTLLRNTGNADEALNQLLEDLKK